jgi:hypothetical protein
VPEIGIGRIRDRGGGPGQKKEVTDEEDSQPWRGHQYSAP